MTKELWDRGLYSLRDGSRVLSVRISPVQGRRGVGPYQPEAHPLRQLRGFPPLGHRRDQGRTSHVQARPHALLLLSTQGVDVLPRRGG